MIKGNWNSRTVFIDDKPLTPFRSQQIMNHSPDGFLWGYGGSGPAQLALAILLEFATEGEAVRWYQHFKAEIIAPLSQDNFEIPTWVVQEWVVNERKDFR